MFDRKEWRIKYNLKNRIKILEYGKKYRLSKKDELNKKSREYHKKNKDRISLQKKDYFKKNAKKISIRTKIYRKNNLEHLKENWNKWYYQNKDNGLYRTYRSIRQRCYCKNFKSYKFYGGKGVISEWNNYEEFKNDMYDSYLVHFKKYGRKQTTIDRIDSDKNYCKENCRWATWEIQYKNKKIRIQQTSSR